MNLYYVVEFGPGGRYNQVVASDGFSSEADAQRFATDKAATNSERAYCVLRVVSMAALAKVQITRFEP